MEELGQLIFVVLFILFGLISGAKRKKRAPVKQRAEPRRDDPEMEDSDSDTEPERAEPLEVPRPDTKPYPARAAPGYADRMVEPKRSVADELLALLQQQGEPVREHSVRLPEIDDETESLETLEAAGREIYEETGEPAGKPQLPTRSPYSAWEAVSQRPYALDDVTAEQPYRIEETPEPEPYSIRERSKRKRNLSRRELRHAFVMREVLGPPKALE